MESFWLSPKEYGKIIHEINHVYKSKYKNQRIAAHISFGFDGKVYVYWFENHGYDD